MKKQLLFLFLLMMPFVAQAQQMLPKFGYFNLSTLMKAVPEYAQKRQAELQDMMEKNIAFKKEAQRLLAQAEQDAMTPVKGKVLDAVRKLGQQRGYAFILNADGDALPYIDMAYGDNLNDAVLSLLAQGGK